jgi:hypothetical protein
MAGEGQFSECCTIFECSTRRSWVSFTHSCVCIAFWSERCLVFESSCCAYWKKIMAVMGLETLVGAYEPVGLSTGVSKLLTLLVTIQAAALASFGGGPNFDPKYFVDIPLRLPVNETARAFDALPRSQNNTIEPSSCSPPPKYCFSRCSGRLGQPFLQCKMLGRA